MTTRSGLGWVALVVAMVVGVLLLVSCSSTPSTPATSGTSTTSTKPQGSLKVAVDFHNGAIFAGTGKWFNMGNTFQALGAQAFDSLVQPGPDGKVRPGIAERWEMSKDGKTHTFYLRKGVKFHNGDDPTAADVKYSLDLMMHPDNAGDAGIWRAAVSSVDIKDDYTMKPDPFDPEGAKKLMTEAGYANGFSTVAWDAGGGSDISTMTQALVGYWRKVGVNADLVAIDRTVALNKFSPKHTPEAWNKIWSYSSGGGIFNFERFYTPCHPTKGTAKNHKNTKLGDLIDRVPTIADEAERKKAAQEAVIMCRDEYATLTYLDVDTLYAVGPKVGQLTPTQGMLGLGFSYETTTHPK